MTYGPPPPIDSSVQAVLDIIPSMPRITLEGIPTIRRNGAALLPSLEALALDGAFTITDVTVPGRAGQPDVAVLRCSPTDADVNRPALVYLHGGGMIAGTPRTGLLEILQRIALPLGMEVLSVDYRLAPEHPHPAPAEDCYAALLWVCSTAEELGVDAARILLGGLSAGGGLAAATALMARDRSRPEYAGLMLICPMLDDRNNTTSAQQLQEVGIWRQADNQIGWLALLGDEAGRPDVSPYAAPARATSLSGLPPAFLDVGTVETFRDEVVAFASRIWADGGDAELHVWPGGIHAHEFLAPNGAIGSRAWDAKREWVTRLLATRTG